MKHHLAFTVLLFAAWLAAWSPVVADVQCDGQANGTPCDDGEPCTSSDTCFDEECIGIPVSNGTACPDDGNPCTSDTCSSGQCSHANLAAGTSCADCQTCNGSGSCNVNKPNTTPCPDDGEACTADVCDQGTCVHVAVPDGTACGICLECASGVCNDCQTNDDCTTLAGLPGFCTELPQSMDCVCLPLGACVTPGGGCTQETSADCGAIGGTYLGDGTVCGEAIPTVSEWGMILMGLLIAGLGTWILLHFRGSLGG